MKPRFAYQQCPHTDPHPGPHTWNRTDDTNQPTYPTLICAGIPPETGDTESRDFPAAPAHRSEAGKTS